MKLSAVGHRVVHGGEAHAGPALVDDAVLVELDKLVALAPLHQPHNLKPIRIVRRELPELPQVACFDTAFHRSQPEIAQMFALPREMRQRGVRRYGFHGLSYDYIASVMGEHDARLCEGRVIVAHLGNGASLCAMQAGVSVATTMGFSALEGLPMGTRCGAVDPGVIFYMLREMRLTPRRPSGPRNPASSACRACRTTCGFCGERIDERGRATCHRPVRLPDHARDRLPGFSAWRPRCPDLHGRHRRERRGDTGRSRRGSRWAGLLDHEANGRGGPLITSGGPAAWVIPTNEELVITRQVQAVEPTHRPGKEHGGRVMEAVKAKPAVTPKADELGDETFMSATDPAQLHDRHGNGARLQGVGAHGQGRQSPRRTRQATGGAHRPSPRAAPPDRAIPASKAARRPRGQTELMVMRFPTALCSDKPRYQQLGQGLARRLRGDRNRPTSSGATSSGPQDTAKRDDRRVARGNAGRRRFFLKCSSRRSDDARAGPKEVTP